MFFSNFFLLRPSVKSVSYMWDSIAKEKKGGKKWVENNAIKREGKGGGRKPNGKVTKICHYFLEHFP